MVQLRRPERRGVLTLNSEKSTGISLRVLRGVPLVCEKLERPSVIVLWAVLMPPLK